MYIVNIKIVQVKKTYVIHVVDMGIIVMIVMHQNISMVNI